MIYFVTKNMMWKLSGEYYTGYTIYKGDKKGIYILHGLPRRVEKAMIAHETWHWLNGPQGSFWKDEYGAWKYTIKKEPIGFILTILYGMFPPTKLLSNINRWIRRIVNG